MNKRGPKTGFVEPMVKSNLTLDVMTLRKLRAIGDGNVSAGVRLAARVAYELFQKGKL